MCQGNTARMPIVMMREENGIWATNFRTIWVDRQLEHAFVDSDQLGNLKTVKNWLSYGPICGREKESECKIVMMREENGMFSHQLSNILSWPSVRACFCGLGSTRKSQNRLDRVTVRCVAKKKSPNALLWWCKRNILIWSHHHANNLSIQKV